MKAKNEVTKPYNAVVENPPLQTFIDEDKIIAQAVSILAGRCKRSNVILDAPQVVRKYLTFILGDKQSEVFGVLYLDCMNRLIKNDELFHGTLTQVQVYPRDVIRAALECNAAGAIYYHNHPSGDCDPSIEDLNLTLSLTQALSVVNVRTLDHMIVGGMNVYSFAEHGRI